MMVKRPMIVSIKDSFTRIDMAYKVIYIENGKRHDSNLIIERRPVGHVKFFEAYPACKKGPYFAKFKCDIVYEKVNQESDE